MPQPTIQLPEDAQSLKGMVLKLTLENNLLREALRLERIKKFGPRSEKLSDDQLQLLEGEPSVRTEEVEQESLECELDRPAGVRRQPKRKAHPGRLELPPELPRREEVMACPQDRCTCGQCGRPTEVIGYETAQELDVEAPKYFVRVIKREKRACRHCKDQGVVTAPVAPKIIEKSKLSDAMIVEVVLRKYRDHLPLYRQSEMLRADAKVDIPRASLCYDVMKVGELCQALAGAMKVELFEESYLQADETPIGVQDAQTVGRNHQGYMFQYSRPHGPVVFDFRMSRGRDGPKEFLKGYRGILQTDGYAGYDQLDEGRILRAGCLTHMRRYFSEAARLAPEDPHPTRVLRKIAQIYAIEQQARDQGLGAEQRQALRQQQSVGLMGQLKDLIVEIRALPSTIPRSALGKACDYALGQWERLNVFLDHGQVEADNNWCENAIRPVALGRKNWLHIGSEEAGKKVAAIMSVMETCRRLKIDLREYLLDVLPGLADRKQGEVAGLTPMAWLRARQTN